LLSKNKIYFSKILANWYSSSSTHYQNW